MGRSRAAYPGNDWRRYKVSTHFRLGEFINDQQEAPSRLRMETVRTFARTVLEPLRKLYGPAYIVSGHRTVAHNEAVGGARNSWHVWEKHPGEIAVDVVFARGRPEQWFESASRMFSQGGVGKYSTHLHVDNRRVRARW